MTPHIAMTPYMMESLGLVHALCALSRARGGAERGAEFWPEHWTTTLPKSVLRQSQGRPSA